MTATAEPELDEPTDPVEIPLSVDVDCDEVEVEVEAVEAVVVLEDALPGIVSAPM